MMPRLSRCVGIYLMVYGGLVALGGAIGLIRVGSWISLFTGLVSGALLILSGIATGRGKRIGERLAAIVTTILLVWFGLRYWWSGNMMPAGLVTLLSLLSLAFLGILRTSAFVMTLLESPKQK